MGKSLSSPVVDDQLAPGPSEPNDTSISKVPSVATSPSLLLFSLSDAQILRRTAATDATKTKTVRIF